MLTVLFSLLFQSVHSYEHFLEQEITFENHSDDFNSKIHTLNHNHENCFVCEFTLSNFIVTEFTTFSSNHICEDVTQKTTTKIIAPEVFSGSLFSHRGPPTIC